MTLKNDELSKSSPTVSVVMAAYNASQYIAASVSSVLAQTFPDFELIVVSDGSQDSAELETALAPYRERIRYIRQDNRGVSGARNAGLRVARGRFYAQIDADDAWKPDYLQSQLNFLEQNPTIDLVYPNAEVFTEGSSGHLDFMVLSPSRGEATFENLVRQNCVVMTGVTARMEAIRKTGYFDESLVSCEDFDFWLRFTKFGGRIGYHQQQLVRYRRGANSLSSDRARMIANLLRVLAKARDYDLTPAERTAIEEETRSNQAVLDLMEGKKALFGKDIEKAIEHLSLANSHLHSRKISLALWALRRSPQMVRWAVNLRRWSSSKSEKAFLSGID